MKYIVFNHSTNNKNQIMIKNVFFALTILTALTFMTSCEKEVAPVNNTNPVGSTTVREIKVDYAIHSVTGNIEVVALVQETDGLVEKTFVVNRLNETITFYCKSGQLLSVKARNINPSHDEVLVSIFVDGNLFRSGSANSAMTWAVASGTPY